METEIERTNRGIRHIYTPELYALDLVKGFIVMLNTTLRETSKWTFFEIIHGWYLKLFNEDIDDEPEFYIHTICRIYVQLIKTGHINYYMSLPYEFNDIYLEVMEDTWWEVSTRRARKITYTLTDLFNITPHNNIHMKEKQYA